MAQSDAMHIDGYLGGKEDEGKEELAIPKVLVQPYKPKISFPQKLKNSGATLNLSNSLSN